MVGTLRRSLLIVSLLLLMEAVLVGMYLREESSAGRRPYCVAFDWSVLWGGGGREYPRSIALYENHLYVTGSTSSFGAGKDDIFLLKYDMDGELIWNRTWGGAGYDMGRGIAAADDGIYVVGFTYPDGEAESVLLKYDSEGRLIWARPWGMVERAVGRAVALDDEGFVYVAGYEGGVMPNKTRAFLLKYGSDGDLIWNRTFGDTGADYCWCITVDDGVYVGGSRGSRRDVQTVMERESQRKSEMYLAKFDFDGDMIWTRSWGRGFENYGWGVSAWRGHIYEVGFSQEASNADVVLLGYNSSGSLRFSSFWGGPYEDYAWGVAGGGKFIYVVGHTFRAEPASWTDALIMKYEPDGTLVWNVTWGGFGSDLARSVVVDGDSVYVIGITYGVGADGQALLLKYTSPNEAVNPLMVITSAASIAVGIVIWMILILEIVVRRYGGLVYRVKAFNRGRIFHLGRIVGRRD